ncbi:MAG: DUF3168 domain-containing protein [Rhodobacteraceae bacterium]|nr:DUF3168 domain-containing protein [Paracoccaceae bacterium]
MSYAISVALQEAVFAALSGDATLAGLIGAAIYDAPPVGVDPTYILLGEDEAKDRSSGTHKGATLDFEINVISDVAGFSTAKTVAAAICDLLIDADLPLSRGSLVNLKFLKSRARRGASPEQRRIALIFRAILDDGSY